MNIAELGVKIDTADAVKAEMDLDKMAKAGERAEQSAVSLMNEMKALEKSLSTGAKTTQELSKQREALAKLTKTGAYGEVEFTKITAQLDRQQAALVKSTLDEQKALNSLLSAIDPARGALAKLDKQVEQLGKHLDAGRISQEQYNSSLSKIDKDYAKLEKTTTGFDKLRLGTRQAQENVVQLGNALASGDFGSGARAIAQIGAGAGASAASLLALAAPIALIAAALGGLGYAYFDAMKQAGAFNRAINGGVNASGQTIRGLRSMAESVGLVTGNLSGANEAVLSLASGAATSSEQMKSLAQAASALSEITGKGAGEIAQSLASAGSTATDAAAKISDQYGLLTYEQYQVIKALDEQGEHQTALDVLSENLSQSAMSRLKTYRESLSDVERDWNSIKAAISRAYAAVRSEVIPDAAQQAEIAQRILDTRKKGGFTGALSNLFSFGSNTNAELRKQVSTYRESNKAEEEAVALKTELENADRALIKTSRELDTQLANVSPEARKAEAYRKLKDQFMALYEAAEKNGKSSPLLNGVSYDGQNFSGGAYDTLANGLNEKSKPRATPRAKAFTEDAGIRALDTARQQYAVLVQQAATIDQQGLGTERIGVHAQALIKWEQQLADIKEKKSLTADQKSLLASQDLITAQLKRNAAIEQQITKQKSASDETKLAEKDRIELLKLTGQALAANAAQSGLVEAAQRLEYERQGNTEALKRLDTLKQIRDVNLKADQKPGTVEGVSKAPAVAGLDAAVGGPRSEIERLDRAAKEIEAWRATELERQKAYLDLKVINEETYAERIDNINQQGREAQTRIEEAKNQALLSGAADFFGNLSALSQSENKKLAAIGKAAAIAQATIQGFVAVQNALAVQPYPLGLALAVSAGVATAANIAGIMGVGYKVGGYTGDGDPNDVAGPVHKREFVFNAPSVARIGVGRLEALQSGELSVDSPAANYAVPAGGSTAASASAESRGASRRSSRNSPSVIQNNYYPTQPDNRTANQSASALARKQRQASRLK